MNIEPWYEESDETVISEMSIIALTWLWCQEFHDSLYNYDDSDVNVGLGELYVHYFLEEHAVFGGLNDWYVIYFVMSVIT